MAYINMIYSPRIIIGILILIWTNDSLAYFGGTLLGKHKLCPNISPKKTIEGLVIGCLGVCGVSLLLGKCYPEWQNTKWILSGICIMIFGNIGDIFASSLKRCTDIKDSGTILPGHGGFLDRFDSLLFAVPFISVLDAFYPYSFLIVY
jgi:phosphatidate cytidylyltransferase